MAPLPKKRKTDDSDFTQPGDALTPIDDDRENRCDGCKTNGTGKRDRCGVGCDFDQHEDCRTYPRKLSTFMHDHELDLVMHKSEGQRQVLRICDVCADPVEGLRQVHRICDVCADPVEGHFYRCKDCEFDVHHLCTRLPQQLKHALDETHHLTLKSTKTPGSCSVCKKACSGWGYRCGECGIDIHLGCVLVPVVPFPQNQSKAKAGGQWSIPNQPPPQLFGNPYYGHVGYNHFQPGYYQHGMHMHPNSLPYNGHGGYNHFQPGYYQHGMHMHPNSLPYNGHGGYNHFQPGYYQHGMHMHPNSLPYNGHGGYNHFQPGYYQHGMHMHPNSFAAPVAHQAGVSSSNAGNWMSSLVGQLGSGVLSNLIFGMDLPSSLANQIN